MPATRDLPSGPYPSVWLRLILGFRIREESSAGSPRRDITDRRFNSVQELELLAYLLAYSLVMTSSLQGL